MPSSAVVLASALAACSTGSRRPATDTQPAPAPAPASIDHATMDHAAHMAAGAHGQRTDSSAPARPTDSAFAALQARGAAPAGMGVDQYTSTHRFDTLADGGRIALQRNADDSAGVAQIRRHLQEIAVAFAAGDFRTPAFVHMQPVPGTATMATRRGVIAYAYGALPGGGEVRITTRDPEALRAVHAFLAFQRGDHRAGGDARR